jgi:predicted TPR repeat methyltransferase
MKDSVTTLFNKWLLQGRDIEMEREHNYAVQIMLKEIKILNKFDFLDIGCGNGWTVRQISKHSLCKSAWGIDVSNMMIRQARALQNSKKQHFLHTDLLAWNTRKRFGVIFSMEALYYIIPVEPAIAKIYNLLKQGGIFLCGVDYYRENRASHSWPEKCNVKMELHSKKEWADLLRKVGFKNIRQRNIRYPTKVSSEKWKQRFGTLFTQGTKLEH